MEIANGLTNHHGTRYVLKDYPFGEDMIYCGTTVLTLFVYMCLCYLNT